MLRLLNARMKALRGVSGENWNLGLVDDSPAVHPLVHEMHRATGDRLARLESLPPRFDAPEFRQQGRMNVNDAPREGLQHWCFEHAHVAGEDDKIDSGAAQSLNQILFAIRGETRLKARFLDPCRRNAGIARQCQNPGVKNIRADDNNPGIEPAGANLLKDGPKVGSFARTEHTETKFMHRRWGSCASSHDMQAMLPNRSFPCNMRRKLVEIENMKADEVQREPDRPLEMYLRERAREVDNALNGLLPKNSIKPATIHRAMRYSLFAGGKRMRPILCLAAAESCGDSTENALLAACSVECVHTYSLIHDDLPCMDDDDFRRGRPTSHKVFGEAIAVLAGDALLTVAFEILAGTRETPRYKLKEFMRELAFAAGSRKLIAGQVADLEGEGRKSSRAELRFTHECKTAAMIVASLKLGAMAVNATPENVAAITKFGHSLGLAFQVIDDILDITQTSEKLGKSAGKDVASQKATYPSLLGLDAARKEARRLTASAHKALEPFGTDATRLHQLADYLLTREY